MRGSRWFTWALALLFTVFGLFLVVLAFLPYGPLKALTGALASDGNFNALKPDNAAIFKLLFGAGGLFFFTMAALTGLRGWHLVWNFIKRSGSDARCFFASLRPQKSELGFLAAVLVIMVLAIIYRLEYINKIMYHDEAYTYLAFARSLFTASSDYHLPNNHIFHTILVWFSTKLFGIQPWAVRLPAFMAGVLLVPAAYWLAKRFYDRWTGLGAALLVAWSPMLISYSVNARGYTLVALFSLLTLALGEYVCREKNLFAWALIILLSALGFYTVPVMLFPFGILFVWLLLEALAGGAGPYRSKWEFIHYWLAAGFGTAILTLLLYLPVLVYSGPAKLFTNGFVSPLSWVDFLPTLSVRLAATWSAWIFRVPLMLLLLLAAGLILGLVFHRKLSSSRVPMQSAALLWIVVLLLVQRPNAWAKVWVFLLPLVLVWAVAGVLGWLQRIRPAFLRRLPLASFVIGLALLGSLWHAAWLAPQLPELWGRHSDEEKIALFVQGQLQDEDLIVTALQDNTPVWYYLKLHGIMDVQYNPSNPFKRALVLTDQAEGQTLASAIAERSPVQVVLDFGSCTLLESVGKMQVFGCQGK